MPPSPSLLGSASSAPVGLDSSSAPPPGPSPQCSHPSVSSEPLSAEQSDQGGVANMIDISI